MANSRLGPDHFLFAAQLRSPGPASPGTRAAVHMRSTSSPAAFSHVMPANLEGDPTLPFFDRTEVIRGPRAHCTPGRPCRRANHNGCTDEPPAPAAGATPSRKSVILSHRTPRSSGRRGDARKRTRVAGSVDARDDLARGPIATLAARSPNTGLGRMQSNPARGDIFSSISQVNIGSKIAASQPLSEPPSPSPPANRSRATHSDVPMGSSAVGGGADTLHRSERSASGRVSGWRREGAASEGRGSVRRAVSAMQRDLAQHLESLEDYDATPTPTHYLMGEPSSD
eukprot:TRINITY_DN8059_c0_g1_i2.p1 TRINITY_DN8059_c0_g1~~TRINITY_DN8059_c0_g1_i2.p1  ORF type:complete len:298 (-),score=4.70 TRINITY_DN8059_c0_g1_i2:24-875(-)